MTTRKQIPISELKPGMHVVGLDRSWLQTPFFIHRKLIKDAAEIEMFKLHGIREVVIDASYGAEIESPQSLEPAQSTETPPPEVSESPPAAKESIPKTARGCKRQPSPRKCSGH